MADQAVTLAQIKARLGIATSDTDDDALLTEFNESVTDYMQDLTRRQLVPLSGATRYFDTGQGNWISVPIGIRTITTLGIASTSQPDTGGTYTTWTGTKILRPMGRDGVAYGVVIPGTAPQFSKVYNGAKIVGDFGPAAVPPRIQTIALDAIVQAYQDRKVGPSAQLGADDLAGVPWADYFTMGTAAYRTLMRLRTPGIG